MSIAVITGASGFVGSHLADYLFNKGFTVRCIVRKSSSLKWLTNKNFELYDCGLFDKEGLRKVFDGAEYIFHVAGVVKSKKPEGYFIGNVEATKVVLETAEEFKSTIKKIVIVSSETVAGPSKLNEPVDEEKTPSPITTYGKSKYEQEKLAQSFMKTLPITICRAPAVYGPRDTEIFIFFNTFSKGLMTKIGFNNKQLSLINVLDLVEGFYLAAISEKSTGQIYFITSSQYYTWDEIKEATAKALNKKPFTIRVPHTVVFIIAAIAQFFSLFSSKAATLNIEKAKDITQPAWTCKPDKAFNDLGFKQKISLEEGIKLTVDWYKKVGWL